ncbi:MAG: hypothetical protein ACFN4N_03215, partial [Streptococcus sp.]
TCGKMSRPFGAALSIGHTRIPSGNEASAFEDFWKPGGQTFPGNMPEGIMKDISTQRGEHTWNIVN